MKLEATIMIARPIEEVFTRWMQFERFPEWFDSSVERRKLTEGPVGVATKYAAVEKLPPGRRVEATLEITAYRPNEWVAARLSTPLNATWETRFEEVESGTRLIFQTEATLSGLQALVAPLLKGWALRQLQAGLERFKESFGGEVH